MVWISLPQGIWIIRTQKVATPMRASKRDRGKPNLPKASGVRGTREQIEAAFRAAAKTLRGSVN
jgi:hypothetical protein